MITNYGFDIFDSNSLIRCNFSSLFTINLDTIFQHEIAYLN